MATRRLVVSSLWGTRSFDTSPLPSAFPSVCRRPAQAHPQKQQKASFSQTAAARLPRDASRQRGVSALRHTGPKQPLSVSKTPLPRPVRRGPDETSNASAASITDEDHGLWEFFHARDKPMNTPEEDNNHGRAWSVQELRVKSWEDLHALWWVCCKERNRIATADYERERVGAGYGEFESQERADTVKKTQKAIKHVLTERYYAWQEAELLAKDDQDINLSGDGELYQPGNFEEDISELTVQPLEPAADLQHVKPPQSSPAQ